MGRPNPTSGQPTSMLHGQPVDDRRPALQPPRFGLLSLLAVMAVLGVLFAISHYFGSYGAALAVLFGLCVVMHVLGNALGTRLRDFGDTPVGKDGSPAPLAPVARPLAATDFAPSTRLGERYSLGRRIVVLTGLGALSGGLLGYFGIGWLSGEPGEWKVLAVGAVACAVLGGIWSYAIASFLLVTVGEFLRAQRHSGQP